MGVVATKPDSVYVDAMNDSLKKLLEAAKTAKQSPAQQEEQRRSFVYGNTAFENSLITREMVDQEAPAALLLEEFRFYRGSFLSFFYRLF